MSRLIDLIDEYKDRHGQPSDSSIARAIGVAPQTLSSWRRRGIRDVPDTDRLRDLARFIGKDYVTVVLRAALIDAGLAVDSDFDGNGNGNPPAAPPQRRDTA